MKKLFLLIMLLSTACLIQAQTAIPSIISTNQTWGPSGSPYILSQNAVINSGVKVTLLPGAHIKASGPNKTLIVNGELQGKGSSSSFVSIDSITIEFKSGSIDYNSSTGDGAYFNYCKFNGAGSGTTILKLGDTKLKIENSNFSGCYNGINSSGNTDHDLLIQDCLFRCIGNPIYSFNSRGTTTIKTSDIYGGQKIYVYGSLTMTENYINGLDVIDNYIYDSLDISCNDFIHMKNGLNLTLYSTGRIQKANVSYNTFDSMSSKMIGINRGNFVDKVKINRNNFLNMTSSSNKVLIADYNRNPPAHWKVDFESNYWMSTDSATIETFVKDFSDDILIAGRAITSKYLSTKVSGCPKIKSCKSSFFIGIDKDTPNKLYLVNDSKGITSNTLFTWDFGDGNSSNEKKPIHHYKANGNYNLCLELSESSVGCADKFCDIVGKALGTNNAFIVQVLSESDYLSINKNYDEIGLTVYPNPSSGKVELNWLSSTIKVLEVSVLNELGQIMVQEDLNDLASQEYSLNIDHLTNGVYYVLVRGVNGVSIAKVILYK